MCDHNQNCDVNYEYDNDDECTLEHDDEIGDSFHTVTNGIASAAMPKQQFRQNRGLWRKGQNAFRMLQRRSFSRSRILQKRFTPQPFSVDCPPPPPSGRRLQSVSSPPPPPGGGSLKIIDYLPPSAPPSPLPPSPSIPPLSCTMDFLSRYGLQPDGMLTDEFRLMEHYAKKAIEDNSFDAYWCDLKENPELQCLDIGSPSTLDGLFDSSSIINMYENGMSIYEINKLRSSTSTLLFGQSNECDGKIVGDGVIDIHDISTLMSYIFQAGPYMSLSHNPYDVQTTMGRTDLKSNCNKYSDPSQYYQSYHTDTCNNRRLSSGDKSVNITMTNEAAGYWLSVYFENLIPLRLFMKIKGMEHLSISKRNYARTDDNNFITFQRECKKCYLCSEVTVQTLTDNIINGIISVYQLNIEQVCPLSIHIWIGKKNMNTTNGVCINHLSVSDGNGGLFIEECIVPYIKNYETIQNEDENKNTEGTPSSPSSPSSPLSPPILQYYNYKNNRTYDIPLLITAIVLFCMVLCYTYFRFKRKFK